MMRNPTLEELAVLHGEVKRAPNPLIVAASTAFPISPEHYDPMHDADGCTVCEALNYRGDEEATDE